MCGISMVMVITLPRTHTQQEAILSSNNSDIFFWNWATSSWAFAWWCEKNRRDFIRTFLFGCCRRFRCVVSVHGNCMVILMIITNSEVIFHSVYAYSNETQTGKQQPDTQKHTHTRIYERCWYVGLPSERLYDYPALLIVFSKSFTSFF